jgi:hypothetical protein
MAILLFGPAYLQTFGYPALHFCLMVERVRATVLAEKYEREGQQLGIWMVAAIVGPSVGEMTEISIMSPHPKVADLPGLFGVHGLRGFDRP